MQGSVSAAYIFTTLMGWIIVTILNTRTINRAEISRVKDNLIKKIEDLQKSLEEFIREEELGDKELERYCVAKCVQVEFYITQLNFRVGRQLISLDKLNLIINNDFVSAASKDFVYLNTLFEDLLEDIEQSYLKRYLKAGMFENLWHACKYDIFGAISAGVLLIIFLILVGMIIS